MTKAFSATVCGRVQGVGFRYSAYIEARRLKLTGWVRNSWDGNVEVWAEGPQAKLDRFYQWLQHGPSYAWVESVNTAPEKPKGYGDFNIRA